MNVPRMNSRIALLTLSTATIGAALVGCSSGADHTAAEPSFNNTFPAFDALRESEQAAVPKQQQAEAPQPTLGHSADDAPHNPHQAPAAAAQNNQAPAQPEHRTNAEAKSKLYEELSPQIPPEQTSGFPATLKGTHATVCLMGNGYGISFVLAGDGTSCEFAKKVGSALMDSAPGSKTDVRTTMPSSLSVTSPVTNETYDMACSLGADELITCTGGNNAKVMVL